MSKKTVWESISVFNSKTYATGADSFAVRFDDAEVSMTPDGHWVIHHKSEGKKCQAVYPLGDVILEMCGENRVPDIEVPNG